ncbi:MAG TPA: polysaccharide pyruvyl transferase family protein [Clostridia bacterium]
MKKIAIRTLYKNNYGSSLQAYALISLIKKQGFIPIIIEEKSNGLEKCVRKGFRGINFILTGLFHKDVFEQYKKIKTANKTLPQKTLKLFNDFYVSNFKIENMTYSQLKKIAKSDEYYAFVCGSDQIWGVSGPYISPINFLQFAPKYKRITYAPSFGVSNIPKYRQKTIKRYLKDFNNISIREYEGARIIKELTGKDAFVALDPTLLMEKNFWLKVAEKNNINKPYILCYFLNEPSSKAIEYVKMVKNELQFDVLFLPYSYSQLQDLGEQIEVSPFGFLDLINHAAFMLTDSFHGMAFAINFNVPFFIFERQYGHNFNQSSRIFSLLKITKLQDRWIDENRVFNKDMLNMDFSEANYLLQIERQKSYDYLMNSIKSIGAQK